MRIVCIMSYPLLNIKFDEDEFDYDAIIEELNHMAQVFRSSSSDYNTQRLKSYEKERLKLELVSKVKKQIVELITKIQSDKKSIANDYKKLSSLVGIYNIHADYLNKHGYPELKCITRLSKSKRPCNKFHSTIKDRVFSIISLDNSIDSATEKLFVYCKSRRLSHAILESEISLYVEMLMHTHNYHLSDDVDISNLELNYRCLALTPNGNLCNKLHLWSVLIDTLPLPTDNIQGILDKKIIELARDKFGPNRISYCIDSHCSASEMGFVIAEPNSNKIKCPECLVEFCGVCRETYHKETPCTGVIKGAVDDETMKYLKQHAVACPKCHQTITKDEGCNHLICIGCKTHLCWRCGGIRNPRDPYFHTCPEGFVRTVDPSEHPDIYLPQAYN
jgi:hypothetical protein